MQQKYDEEITLQKNKYSMVVTRKDLQNLALSDYLIREITRTLDWSYVDNRARGYIKQDIKQSIHVKLSKPKTRKTTQIKLTKVLDWLNSSDINVIKVDFSNPSLISVDRTINALKKRIEYRQQKIEANMKVLESLEEEEALLQNSYEELMIKVNAAIGE